MQKHSNNEVDIQKLRDQIIGLGEDSIRKSYYPKLRYHIDELERFRAILDQSQDMIILVDFTTRQIVDINYTVSLTYKLDKKHILNTNVEKFFSKEIIDKIDIIQKGNIEELKNCCIVEVEIDTPKGKIPMEFSLQKIDFEDRAYIIIIGTNITERKKAKEKIYKLDFYDSLTGLANKKMLLKHIRDKQEQPLKNTYSAILLIDLDNFKAINDTKGHKIGDTLLIEVANRLRSLLKDDFFISRSGGDDFIIFIDKLKKDLNESIKIIEDIAFKIKNLISQSYNIENEEYVFSSSIGIEIFKLDSLEEESILKHPEIAMYEAKNSGRNTIRFYDPKMQEAIQDKISLENELKTALDKKQFSIHYQPQMNTQGKLVGLEALLRWNHPQRGLIPPNIFIPLAEESGMIIPIGEWVTKEACKQLKEFENSSNTNDVNISVNVSIKQFQDKYFASRLTEILEETNAPRDKLLLELTESIFIDNVEEVIKKMQEIKELGVSFSMDDFGTGYSSLSSLKKLPLHELKVDQSFVRDIGEDPNDAIIVKTIIGMAKNLGLHVVAEGVETKEQLEFLKEHECDIFQGYFFSRPLPIKEINKIFL